MGEADYTFRKPVETLTMPRVEGSGPSLSTSHGGAGLSKLAGRWIAALIISCHSRILGSIQKITGVIAMSGRSRSVLLASLVPAVLLGGVFAVVQAQNAGAPAAKATKWSDPATWPNKQGAGRG